MQKCPNSCCQCNFICTLWLQRSKVLIARSDTILSSARLGRAGRETVSEGLSNGLFPPPSRRSQALAQHVLRVPDHAGILQQQKITAPVLPRAAFQAERGARLPDSKKKPHGGCVRGCCGPAARSPSRAEEPVGVPGCRRAATRFRGVAQKPSGNGQKGCRAGSPLQGWSRDAGRFL